MTDFVNIPASARNNQVSVSHFENPAVYWIKKINCQDPLFNFAPNVATRNAFEVGDSVAVNRELANGQKEWYRGQIMEVYDSHEGQGQQEGRKYRVFLVDEGRTVIKNEVFRMDEKYAQEPYQAYLVALHCVRRKGAKVGGHSTFLPCKTILKEIIDGSSAIFYQQVKRQNGINFGNIYVMRDRMYFKIQDEIRDRCPNALDVLPEDEFSRVIPKLAKEYRMFAMDEKKFYREFETEGDDCSDSGFEINQNVKSDHASRCLLEVCREYYEISEKKKSQGPHKIEEFTYSQNCCAADDFSNSSDATPKSTFEVEVDTCVSHVLVHSNVTPPRKLEINFTSVQEAAECGILSKELAKMMRLADLTTCQIYALPAIASGHNVVLLSGAKLEMRRMSYVMHLANALINFTMDENDVVGNIVSPIAIIVCPYATDCEEIRKMLSGLVRRKCDIDIVLACGYKVNTRQLAGRNIILIGTPRFVLHLLTSAVRFKFSNTRYFIVDSSDILYDKYRKDVDALMESLTSDKHLSKARAQIIVSTNVWFRQLKRVITNQLKHAIILIAPSALMEAALYSKSKFTLLHDLSKDVKIFRAQEFLSKHIPKPTAILCQDDEEVSEVARIDFGSRVTIFVRDGDDVLNRKEIASQYVRLTNEKRNPILICTDGALRDVCVENARLLIHYSVPESRMLFTYRFSTLLSNYRSIFSEDCRDTHVVALLDDAKMLKSIYDWIKRTGVSSPEIENRLICLRKIVESAYDLCEGILEFGKCHAGDRCKGRHFLVKKDDLPVDYLPASGNKIRLKIGHTYSATHFAVKMTEIYENGSWRKINYAKNCYSLVSDFAIHPGNLTFAVNVQKGDVALAQLEHHHTRVKILSITDKKASVKLIDEGGYAEVARNDIFWLPDQLKNLPYSVVDLFVCGATPVDDDVIWYPDTTNWVKSKLKEFNRVPDKFFTAKIALALGTSIWCASLDWENKVGAKLFRIPASLIMEKFAEKNTTFLPHLYELCRRARLNHLIPTEKPKIDASKLLDTVSCKTDASTSKPLDMVSCKTDTATSKSFDTVSNKTTINPGCDTVSIKPTKNAATSNLHETVPSGNVSASKSLEYSDNDSETDNSDSSKSKTSVAYFKKCQEEYVDANGIEQDLVGWCESMSVDDLLATTQVVADMVGGSSAGVLEELKRQKREIERASRTVQNVQSEQPKAPTLPVEPLLKKLFLSSTVTPQDISEYFANYESRIIDHIPNVRWYQSFTHIFVKVMIEGAEDCYSIYVNCTSLTFKATVNDKTYLFCLRPLFGAIYTDFEVKYNRSYVMIKLRKLIQSEWYRLVRGLRDRPWLSRDTEVEYSEVIRARTDAKRRLMTWNGRTISSPLLNQWKGLSMNEWEYHSEVIAEIESGCDDESCDDEHVFGNEYI